MKIITGKEKVFLQFAREESDYVTYGENFISVKISDEILGVKTLYDKGFEEKLHCGIIEGKKELTNI